MYILVHGYGGALSRHMILSVCLEVCGHVCGLGSFCTVVCLCCVRAIPFAATAGPHIFRCCFVGPVRPLLVFSACRVFGIVRKTKETLPKFFWKLSKFVNTALSASATYLNVFDRWVWVPRSGTSHGLRGWVVTKVVSERFVLGMSTGRV